MSAYPQRSSLEGLEIEIFELVSECATREQWAEWLRAPLEHAAVHGNHALVDKLLRAGADGSAGWKGCHGRSLLFAAAVGGSKRVVASLLRAGAQPDVNVISYGPSFGSPLYQVTLGGYEAAAKLLIHAGADVNFSDPSENSNVLHEALWGGHGRIAEGLLMGGADVYVRDCDESTPLHAAASVGLDRMVSALLLRGADKDAVDKDGDSALSYACGALNDDEVHPAVVETLLAAGADINSRGWDGRSALDSAARSGCVPITQALVRHGADVNSRDPAGGNAPLHSAAVDDEACSIDALIEAGADMEMETNLGRTPLCVAAALGSSKALLALLRKGSVLSAQDAEGSTPLHLACSIQPYGVEAVVDNLLRWGADETALDIDGETPQDLLDAGQLTRKCSQDDIERVRLLLSRAPADRAWRRRGWVVMLRSRSARAGVAGGDSSDNGAAVESSGSAANETGEGRKSARRERAVGGASSKRGQAGNRCGSEALRGAVGWLLGMQPEGVFRTVLEFL